jgi:hypothetical protein
VLVATISVVNPGWYPVVQARLYDALGPASGLALTDGALFPVERAAPARDRRHSGAVPSSGAVAAAGGTARAARVRPRVQPAASSVTPSVSRQRAKRPLRNIATKPAPDFG